MTILFFKVGKTERFFFFFLKDTIKKFRTYADFPTFGLLN
jgi:hypothetical protein